MPNLLSHRLAAEPNPDVVDAFTSSLLRSALAKMAHKPAGEARGFEIAEGGALEALVDVVKQRIMEVGARAAELADVGSSSAIALDDVVTTLDQDAGVWPEVLKIIEGYKLAPSLPTPDYPWVAPPAADPKPKADEKRPLGARYPPFPPAHTYKQSRVDVAASVTEAEVTDLARAAHERRTLVRESLAHLLRKEGDVNAAPTAGASKPVVFDPSLAPPLPGDFEKAVATE